MYHEEVSLVPKDNAKVPLPVIIVLEKRRGDASFSARVDKVFGCFIGKFALSLPYF